MASLSSRLQTNAGNVSVGIIPTCVCGTYQPQTSAGCDDRSGGKGELIYASALPSKEIYAS